MQKYGMNSNRALRFSLKSLIAALVIGSLWFSNSLYRSQNWNKPSLELSSTETEPVRRVSFDVSINAPGEIRSADNTIVECEIERLAVYTRGGSMVSGASTRILKLVPDGSVVKKNDVICKLDSSAVEELVRLQKINLQQATSMHDYTKMDLEVAKIALEEYKNGTAKQYQQTLRGQIALATSDASRTTGRLAWSRKMFEKGYLSKTTVRAEELSLQRSDLLLTRSEIALKTFNKYTLPKTEHSFESRIQSQNYLLKYYQRWVASQRERLTKFEEQVAKCTVKAPHDGVAIYANEEDGDTRIEEGSEIRQGQDIFYLPDLDNMQVLSKLSETIVEKVRAGMKVAVFVQSQSGTEYSGVVEKVSEFPIPPSSWRSAPEVKNYYCVVKIDGKPEDLRPGLTAEIKVLTDVKEDILAVSPEVIHVENDKEYCFVLQQSGEIEKREVRTTTGDPGTLAVLEGLEEGELVLRSPRKIEDQPELIDKVVALSPQPTQLIPTDPQVVQTDSEHESILEPTHVENTSEKVADIAPLKRLHKDGH